MNRVLHSLLFVSAAASTFTLAACARRVEGSAGAVSEPAVAVRAVERGDIARTLTIAAAFKPFQEIEVHAKVAGYLKTITVDVGDRVTTGQLLAVLEVPELENEVQQDDAAVKRAEEEVNRSQAEVNRARSTYDVAHMAATRLDGVMKARPKLVAQQDVDDADGRDRVAEAQVATAQAALASSAQQLDMAKAAREKTRTLIAYSRITAPFAGVITHRYADTGAMIQAGTSSQTQAMPVVRLSQNSRLRLVIPVPESAVSRVHVGSPVRLSVDALNKTLTGTVARFADRLDADTRTMHVEVDVENRDLSLVPGMYANASLILDEARDAVVAPIEALDRSEAGTHVLVVGPDHRIAQRDISLGLESGSQIAVTRGLSPGELVVVGNRSQLKPGMAVTTKVVAPQPAEATK